jgi:hypothetical protein
VRDRARRERGDAGTGCGRRLDPRLGNRPDEFPDQERDAAGRLVAGRREGRLHLSPEPLPHQLGHRPLTQRRKDHHIGRRAGGQSRQQRRTVTRAGGPRRGEDRDRQLLQPSAEKVQEAQRGRVGPVDIVYAQQQRAAPPQVRA